MTLCKHCNKEIEINHRLDAKKIFCNRSCSAAFNNKSRVVGDKQKQKCRETLFKTLEAKGWVKEIKPEQQKLTSCARCNKQTRASHGLCRKCAKKPYICKRCGKYSSTEFCLSCIRLNRIEATNIKIVNGEYTTSNMRSIKRYVILTRGHACEICHQTEWMGQPIPLVLDHINGRSSDNRLDNLRVVCGNCDMQLPTYKSKNKNSDRKSRKGAW